MGIVDFHPSGECAVIFLAGAELVEGQLYRKKLVQLKAVYIYTYTLFISLNNILRLQVKGIRKVIVVERSQSTLQQFASLQQFATIELELNVIPITENSLHTLLIQMVF